jgi:hypothetical protein
MLTSHYAHSASTLAALLMDFLNTPEKRDRRMIHVPMGRFGEAIEQAKAVLFRTSFPPILRAPSLG